MVGILYFCGAPSEYLEGYGLPMLSPSNNPSPKIPMVAGIQGGRIANRCVFLSSHLRMMKKIPGFSPQSLVFKHC